MSSEIADMKAKIEAIQNSEAIVFDPNTDIVIEEERSENPISPIAQEGSGAV
jgi:hypothetical protein